MSKKPDVDARRYEARKAAARATIMAQSLAGRDIGTIPPVADPARRAVAERQFRQFCEAYLPRVFALPWCPDHLTALTRVETAVLSGGLYAYAMPRGSGKTAIATAAALWALLCGHREFVCLIGATEEHAVELLDSLRAELETNPLLLADYPEVCYPIACLEGIVNRCAGQLCGGERTQITWTAKVLVLPTIAGSRASGAIVQVAGLTGRIRGMTFKRPDGRMSRPSLVILDDPQTDESARSLSQCATRERILAGAVLGMAGPGVKMSGIMPCTVIRPGDMADKILSRKLHPEWNGERTRMLLTPPSNEKAWQRYAEVRADSLRLHGDIRDATAHYIANRDVLDAGAAAAWAERYNPDEVSAIQHAMNLKLQDPRAFAAEYQNEPLAEATAEDEGILKADQIAEKTNGHGRGVAPLTTTILTAFVDVQGKLLYYAVCAWEADFTGYILDYGSYPDQGRPYYRLNEAQPTLQQATKATGLEGAIYGGLSALTGYLCGREWTRDGGSVMRVARLLVDANWGASTNVVYQFCRQSPHAAVLLPSHGRYVGAGSRPMAEYTNRPGDRAGLNWRVPNPTGTRAVRHIVFDANFWKSFVHTRLAVSMGDKGCLSLYGRDPNKHRMLADHLTSEYRVKTEGRGRIVDEWRLRPETQENHWLDCLVGCAVAASLEGAGLPCTDAGAPKKPRIKLSELQGRR